MLFSGMDLDDGPCMKCYSCFQYTAVSQVLYLTLSRNFILKMIKRVMF